jgi:hypothetical protein
MFPHKHNKNYTLSIQTLMPSTPYPRSSPPQEHYKSWGTKPATAYRDVPVFTGSLLYPDQHRYLTTTTDATFRGEKGQRPQLIKQAEGNIPIEGTVEGVDGERETERKRSRERE